MSPHWFDDLTEQAGALHVHTVKSNGAGTLAEVVAAAERAGLSFLIITDHDTRGYADEGAEGWHGNVLVLAGEEVSTGSARFMVLGHVRSPEERSDLREALRSAQGHGGITVALPPEDATARLPASPNHRVSESSTEPPPAPPVAPGPGERAVPLSGSEAGDWPLELVHGWEFWCGLEDWARGRADRAPMTDPFSRTEHIGLRGPRRPAVRMWDALTRAGRVLGFAGLNAHGRSWASTSPGAALPYETLFKSLSTHVLVPELPRDDAAGARRCLLDGLLAGHFHTVHSSVGSPAGFRFVADIPGENPLMEGDRATFHPHSHLFVRLPADALLKIVHNGSTLFTAEGHEFDFPAVAPGVYRVEVWNERRPWIFSNPIWLDPPGEEQRAAHLEEIRRLRAEAAREGFGDILDLAT